MSELADLSVEFGHVYATDDHLDAEAMVATALTTIGPIVDGWRRSGKTVSTAVLVDDYFGGPGIAAKAWAHAEAVADAARGTDLAVDYLVSEAACTTPAAQILNRLVPEPRFGIGSADTAESDQRWVDNGDPPRPTEGTTDRPAGNAMAEWGGFNYDDLAGPVATRGPDNRRPLRAHSIALDVELHADGAASAPEHWSCASLAATWQLTRLGMYRTDDGRVLAPEGTRRLTDTEVPLAARRTLSLLDPEFLPVEHAVRTIISSLDPPDAWLAPLREGPEPVDTAAALARISYIFAGRATGLTPYSGRR